MVTLIPHNIKMTVQEVGGTGAGVTPMPFSFLRKKSCGARRALAALGSNNAQLNMNMAQSHFTMAQEVFTSRWNFNPVKEVPLASGRYQWAPLSSGSDKEIISTSSVVVAKDITSLKDITNPTLPTRSPPAVAPEVTVVFKSKQDNLENNATVSTSNTKQGNSDNEDTSDSENRKEGPSPSCETVIVSTKKVSSKSQICITEFFRPQKRKSSYHCEDSQPSTPPKKKLRTIH